MYENQERLSDSFINALITYAITGSDNGRL